MKDTTGVHVISSIVPYINGGIEAFNAKLAAFIDTTGDDLDGVWSLAGPVQVTYVPDLGVLYTATFRRDESA